MTQTFQSVYLAYHRLYRLAVLVPSLREEQEKGKAQVCPLLDLDDARAYGHLHNLPYNVRPHLERVMRRDCLQRRS